jgi:DNA-binding MarR family transcriptional regulator
MKDRRRSDRVDSVPQALGRLRVALDDAYARAAREVGLTAQQAELLCAAMQPAAVGDLAETLRCDRSNVSRLLDRAAARGFLRRRDDEEDGRRTMVELTPDGLGLARGFLAALESRTAGLIDRWSDQRQQLAAGVLDELSETLDASKATPGRRKGRTAKPEVRS